MQMNVYMQVTEKGKNAPHWSLQGDLNGEISLADLLAWTRDSLILIADTALNEEQAKGFDKNPVVTVDGKIGAPVTSVKPIGQITFTSTQSISDVMLFIYAAIEDRSPMLTGTYKSSNYVFFNGTQVATDMASLQLWLATTPEVKENDLIRFVNIQPYARKLERLGITGDRPPKIRQKKSKLFSANQTVLAPNGTYYLASRAAQRLYKQNVQITFNYLPGNDMGLLDTFKRKYGTQVLRKTKKPRKSQVPRTYLYPTIRLQIRAGGIE